MANAAPLSLTGNLGAAPVLQASAATRLAGLTSPVRFRLREIAKESQLGGL
jgi:hypothetical protein